MRVADTSALYALFAEDDAHHAGAMEEVRRTEPILVPAEVLSETIGLLEWRAGPATARRAASFLHALPHVEMQPTPDDPWDDIRGSALSVFQAAKVSYADAIVVAWCRRRRLRPLTFDRAILRLVGPG